MDAEVGVCGLTSFCLSLQHVLLEPHQAGGRLVVATIREENLHHDFNKRKVWLHGNDWIDPLPATVADPVGRDINDIPMVVADIQERWASGSDLNNITAWCFGRELTQRIQVGAPNGLYFPLCR